jgi:AcrR family transcriptional regulator
MPRTTISGQKASNKRDKVISASVQLFASRGVASTSMRQIARAVGITDATLYHYFPSKDALLEAAFRSASFQVGDLESAFEGTPGSLHERLVAVGEAFLSVLAHDPAWTRLVVREGLRLPDDDSDEHLGSLLRRLGRHRVAALAEALRREPRTGHAPKLDEELAAAHFFHACVGFWIGEALIANEEPSRERRTAFLDHLVGSIVGGERR